MGVQVYIPSGNDIESVFLTEAHLSTALSIEPAVARQLLADALNDRSQEHQRKYVNTRIENEKRKGRQVDAGGIAVEFSRQWAATPMSVAHGKILLKAVRDRLRGLGIEDKILQQTKHIVVPELAFLRK